MSAHSRFDSLTQTYVQTNTKANEVKINIRKKRKGNPCLECPIPTWALVV